MVAHPPNRGEIRAAFLWAAMVSATHSPGYSHLVDQRLCSIPRAARAAAVLLAISVAGEAAVVAGEGNGVTIVETEDENATITENDLILGTSVAANGNGIGIGSAKGTGTGNIGSATSGIESTSHEPGDHPPLLCGDGRHYLHEISGMQEMQESRL